MEVNVTTAHDPNSDSAALSRELEKAATSENPNLQMPVSNASREVVKVQLNS